MTKTMTRVAAALWLMGAGPAAAAPFCLDIQGIPLQCLYADPATCQMDAAKQGGFCSANPTEVHTPPGLGQYCLVVGNGAAECIYPDRGSCYNDAQRAHGACVEANTTIAGTPDPFRVQRPY